MNRNLKSYKENMKNHSICMQQWSTKLMKEKK